MKYNIDITTDLVPIRPAAHYAMGGVATDLQGATSLAGLFAAGEVASTGVHGANRLASNSLLEGLVFGARSAAAMLKKHVPLPFPSPKPNPRAECAASATPQPTDPQKAVDEARSILWQKVAIIRDGKNLSEAVKRLCEFAMPDTSTPSRQTLEARNILTVAPLIARCALAREESRGAHYRSDFPLKKESKQPQHSYISKNSSPYFE
jgi:L-aspartate oxidase